MSLDENVGSYKEHAQDVSVEHKSFIFGENPGSYQEHGQDTSGAEPDEEPTWGTASSHSERGERTPRSVLERITGVIQDHAILAVMAGFLLGALMTGSLAAARGRHH